MPFFQNVPVNTAKDWADEVKLFCEDRLKITNHKFMKQDNMKRCVIETDQPLTKINQTKIKKVSMVVKKKPRIVEKKPSIVKQEPMIVKQEPRLVKQEPRFAKQQPKWEQRPIDLSVLTPMHLPYVHETPIDLSTTRLTSTPETALDLSTSGPSAMHLPSVHEAAIDLSTTGLTSIHTPSTPEVAMDLSTGPIDLSTFSH